MHYSSLSDLQRLVDHGLPEGPSLEYKRELHLDGKTQKLEMLKDLTGMGNGGGGTVIFGIAESEDDFPEARTIAPIRDATLVGKLEDIVRAGVRPPLLMECSVIEVADGFALAVDVQPSGLGPYMVQAYGNMQYHQRIGTRTAPMSEQQVRDAYAVALRSREHRADLWSGHALPMALEQGDGTWVSVSALPEEPLAEVLDVGTVDVQQLQPSGALGYHSENFGLAGALRNLTRWADGLYGHDGSDRYPANGIARLHRDGAAALAVRLHNEISAVLVARIANAALAYLGWFWHQTDLQRPVELHCRVENLRGAMLRKISFLGQDRPVQEPPGVPVQNIEFLAEVLPWELGRAGVRHRLVRRVVDRLHHAFGFGNWTAMFENGQLYGADHRPARCSIGGAGVWNDHTHTALAHLWDDGRILDHHSKVIAYLNEGVVLDGAGHTVGVVELATGRGCPDDFLPGLLTEDPRMRIPGGNPGHPHSSGADRAVIPVPTGRWSPRTLPDLLQAP